MKSSALRRALPFAIAFAFPGSALADDDACYLHREMPLERQLRRLSIDLRGTVPDVAEYDALEAQKQIPDEVIDAYVDSDEFRIQMRRYHESLLWTNPLTNLGDTVLNLSSQNVAPAGQPADPVYYTTGKRKIYRGGDGTHACQNVPQSMLGYEANGMPKAELKGQDAVGDWFAEGWVEVHPYWDPDPTKKLKVCAFDAQISETYTLLAPDPDAGTHSCDHVLAGNKAKECGCGPDLNYCMLGGVVEPAVLGSMREQLLRLVDDHTSGGAPYSDILQTPRMWMNGPLVHYFRYIGQKQTFSRTQNIHTDSDGTLPDLAYTDIDKWVEVEREEPHAGLLTLPAYLLRFQTNRGRANRYRIAFQGQYFQPPSTKDIGCAAEGEDLTERCVCRGCHVTLEPLAAYFGKFVEAGTTSLRDYTEEFKTAKECQKGIAPASAAWCDRFYVQSPDSVDPDLKPYRLKALRFADAAHPDVQPHFDAGPAGLAKADIASGLFHRVTVRQLFEHLMKRETNLDPTSLDFEGDTLEAIAMDFQSHDNLKLLVKALVKLPQYRRMP
jgi:hypothetical protein